MSKKIKAAALDLDAIKAKLAQFIENNPSSEIISDLDNGEAAFSIKKPWDDESLGFYFSSEAEDLFDALNNLLLPERFSAIYHLDTKKFEILWTAYKLPETQKEIVSRAFKFTFDGNVHKCHFTTSSDRLLTLAKYAKPLKLSYTAFRNMQSFDNHVRLTEQGKTSPAYGEPISFWIENIEWDNDAVTELITNLNFYLTYYDNDSPSVLIHSLDEDKTPHPRCRYVADTFPKNISAQKLDTNLISFWLAAETGDPARRFQYYYRIIEYASFFYLEGSAKQAVKKILSSPNAIDDIASVTEKLMAAFQMSKLDEYARFAQIIQDTVDPKLLWKEIKGNQDAFSKEFKFDGGFVLKPLVANTTKESTFLPKGLETFTKTIRDIRNALSHGRDQKTGTVITPTSRNLKALQPWVHLIASAAGEVVLYKDVT